MASKSQGNLRGSVNNTLCSQLRSDNVDPVKLCNDWFESSIDWESKKRDLTELLFHSIGWFAFSTDRFSLADVTTYITQTRDDPDNPALEPTYLTNYEKFMERLISHESIYCTLDGFKSLDSFGDAVIKLKKGSYDSYRIIASITGIALMSGYFKTLVGIPDATGSSDSMNISGSLDGSQSKRLIHKFIEKMKNSFFAGAIRDVCQEIRVIVYQGMLKWSTTNPAIFLEPYWTKFLIFGMHDDPKYYVLEALKNVFQMDLDPLKQTVLFKSIQRTLVERLSQSAVSCSIVMEIVSSSLRFLNPSETPQDMEKEIAMHIFHPKTAIGVAAAKFSCWLHPKNSDTPENTLKYLARINLEASVSGIATSAELIIDSFSSNLNCVRWEHWLCIFKIVEPVLTLSSVQLFLHYVKKITTNYVPSGRQARRVRKGKLKAAQDSFTMFFSKNYSDIMDIDNIKNDDKALSLLILSMSFFSGKISSAVALRIISRLSDIIKSPISIRMSASCWKALERLKTIAVFGRSEKEEFSKQWTSIKCHVFDDFLDYAGVPNASGDGKLAAFNMLQLVKCDEMNDREWETCCEKLKFVIETYPDSESISAILKIPFNIVFYAYKILDSSAPGDEENDNYFSQVSNRDSNWSERLIKLSPRFSRLQNFAKLLIQEQFTLLTRVEAFKVMATGLECFGKHMVRHPVFVFTCSGDDEYVAETLMKFTVEVMRWNPKEELVIERVCCDIVRRTCKLLVANFIQFDKMSELLSLITPENNDDHLKPHGVIIMKALKMYSSYPNSAKAVVSVIFQTFLKLRDELSSNQQNEQRTKSALDYWKLYVDFSSVLHLPAVQNECNRVCQTSSSETGIASSYMLTSRTPLQHQIGESTLDEEGSIGQLTSESSATYSAFRRNTADIGHFTFPGSSTPVSHLRRHQ